MAAVAPPQEDLLRPPPRRRAPLWWTRAEQPAAAAAAWPGAERREPRLSSPGWAVRRPLADWLRAEAQAAEQRRPCRVLDVGCGSKPYYPLFAGRVDEYVGVDVVENPHADIRASADALPVADGSFDIVLCIQVLEHVADPAAVVRELHRVLAPGGVALVSTHGVQVYHPAPADLWRWTQEGLHELFSSAAPWASLRVEPCAGSAATVTMLVATYLHLLAKRAHMPATAAPLIALLNLAGHAVDRALPLLASGLPGTIAPNYHVTAVRAP